MARIGRQTPTQSVVLPYAVTRGQEAVDLYNRSGRTAQEWQTIQLDRIMGVNEDGLWTHVKYGYSVPRRNGKSEILMMRELWGLVSGEHILHTAHRTTTSHATWEKLCDLLARAGFVEGTDYRTIKQFGLERIEMLTGEGKVNFRTRSSKGGLGEGYDLLIIDEAQEYTDDQETALKYVVTDSRNPQTLFCGTPPTVVSAGTVFLKYRKNCLTGQAVDSGWAEWSVEDQSDVRDKELWYETNPSLGTIFTERAVTAEISDDPIDFNIQRLGLWLKYNQKSAISRAEWETLGLTKLPRLQGKLFVGIKYGVTGENAALSVAVRTADDRILVEGIGCRSVRDGSDWLLGFLEKATVDAVIVDGANGQQLLAKRMQEMKLKPDAVLPTVKQVIQANAAFEQGVLAGMVCHMGQPSLVRAVSNCEKRSIGNAGGFGYRAIREDVEIAVMDSAILAYWACAESKAKKKQRARY